MRRGGTGAASFMIATACLAVSLVGCADADLGTVSGTVTYEGAPLETGDITFLPVDGKGAAVGGKITAGAYSVAEVPPGKKIVQIIAVREVNFAHSTEEMARRAQEAQARGDGTGLIEPADIIPPDAAGNNQEHDVVVGDQKIDIALTKPAA